MDSAMQPCDKTTFAQDYLQGLKASLDRLSLERIEAVISIIEDIYKRGNLIFIAGNGGSAATASHMACDLGKTVLGRRPELGLKRLRVIALSDNMPLITAWANDTGYERIFAEQLENLISEGDLLIVITGSGNSPNIIEAVKVAKRHGAIVVGMLGFDGGKVRELVDEHVTVESDNYGYIEDIHMVLDHLITAYFKRIIANE